MRPIRRRQNKRDEREFTKRKMEQIFPAKWNGLIVNKRGGKHLWGEMDGWGIETKRQEGEGAEELVVGVGALAVWAPTCRWDREENGRQIRRGAPERSFPHNEGLILGREMPSRRQAHPGAVTAYQLLFYTRLDRNASALPSHRFSCDRWQLMVILWWRLWTDLIKLERVCLCFVTALWRIVKRHAKLHTHTHTLKSRVLHGVLKCVTMKMPPQAFFIYCHNY